MPIGYEIKTEGISTIVNGKEFNLATSKLLSSLKLRDGGITAMYQDDSGEYFIYQFEPRKDTIVRVDQTQASRVAEILNSDGEFNADEMNELVDAGVFQGRHFESLNSAQDPDDYDDFADIPDHLVDRHREMAAQHHMTFNAWIIQCLERAATTN